MNIKAFRKRNGIRQSELADFLGVTEGYLSRVENGYTNLSDDKRELLMNNENSWDLSALDESEVGVQAVAVGDNAKASNHINIGENSAEAELRRRVEELLELLERERKQNEKLMQMIDKLVEKIGG